MDPRRPLRVLQVADSLDVGGAEAHIVGLAAGLQDLGNEVEIACSVGGTLAAVALAEGVPVHPLMDALVKRTRNPEYDARVASLVREGGFDVVHAHMHASAVAASAAASSAGVPLVVTVHSEGKWRDARAREQSREVYAQAARVITVSEGIRAGLVASEGVPAGKVEVIMNTLSPVWQRSRAAATAGIAPVVDGHQGPLIGVIARLQPDKGVEHFIKAAARLRDRVPEASFVIVGDGPLRPQLEDAAEDLGISDQVCFLGHLADARPILETLDILVVPSVSEGSPLVILEAMDAGVPLVASSVGGIPEQVSDGTEALLVPPSDPEAIADAVLRLHRSPGLADSLARAAARRFARHSDHQAMLQRTMAVYLEAARLSAAVGGERGS